MLALMFQVGANRVALDVRHVQEVVPRVRLTPAAGMPAWVAGAFVYRGHVVPVIDLHRLIGAGECPLHLSSRIILVPTRNQPSVLVGFLATQVAEICEVDPDQAIIDRTGTPTFGPAIAVESSVLHLFDPDTLLAKLHTELEPLSGGAIS